jgi:hypothetical protein
VATATRVPARSRLVDSPDVQLNVRLPFPVSETLDALVRLANIDGAITTRREIVGALIHTAPREPRGLAEKLGAYRSATAGDAAIGRGDRKSTLTYARHPRGPRSNSQAGRAQGSRRKTEDPAASGEAHG